MLFNYDKRFHATDLPGMMTAHNMVDKFPTFYGT